MILKKVVLIFLLLSFCLPLCAAEALRIGFISVTDPSIESSLGEQLFTWAQQNISELVTKKAFEESIQRRLMASSKRAYLQEVHLAIAQNDGKRPSDLIFETEEIAVADSVAVEWVYLSDFTKQVRKEPILYDYLLRKNNLDAFLIFSTQSFDQFYRLRLSLVTLDEELLLDAIVKPEELSTIKGELYLALLKGLATPNWALLAVTEIAPTASLAIDGFKVTLHDGFVPLMGGPHTVTATASGYKEEEKRVLVEPGEVFTLNLPMEKEVHGALLITSLTNDAQVKLSDGLTASLPFVWAQQSPPYSLYVYEKGYLPLIKQVNSSTAQIEVSLNPPWLKQGEVIKRGQRDFYSALAKSLILAASTILFDTLSHTFQGEGAWQTLAWASVGAMAVSSYDAAYKLFAYYQKTKYSSQ